MKVTREEEWGRKRTNMEAGGRRAPAAAVPVAGAEGEAWREQKLAGRSLEVLARAGREKALR